MRIKIILINCLILSSTLVRLVGASDGSTVDQFLGSPLLILSALLVIDIVLMAYHKLRK